MKTLTRSWLLLALLQGSGAALAFQVDNGNILDGAGQPVQLRGVNWFGFETSDHVAHGLWSRNWKDMIGQMKSLGFNAVRIPFCPGTLQGLSANSINQAANPDLAGKNSLQVLDLILAEFDRQGFYILLDHHRLDCNAGISELWYDGSHSEQSWISDLTFVAARYKTLPHFLGVDLKNEPHGAATWGVGNAATDWNKAAERAAAAVLAVAPDLLIFVEGVENNPSCSGPYNHWWGGNLEPIACTPLAIPANRLVLSPHVYGPDVYNQPYFSAGDFPNNMPSIWDAHFGRFHDGGYAIAIGETGGRYGHGGDPKDKVFQDALIDYLGQKNIRHLFYWSWNPNSGDTGPIVQDDSTNVWQDKVTLLQRLWNGTGTPAACGDGLDNDGDGKTDYPADPGCSSLSDYTEADAAPPPAACGDGLDNDGDGKTDYPADPGCSSLADTDEYNAAAPAACGDGLDNDGDGKVDYPADPGCSSTADTDEYNTPPPPAACADGQDNDGDGLTDYPNDPGCTSASDTDEYNPPLPPTQANLAAKVTVNSDWGAGYCADLKVTNTTAATVRWTTAFSVQGSVQNLWNAAYTQTGDQVTASGLDWNGTLLPGAFADFGFCGNRPPPAAACADGRDNDGDGQTDYPADPGCSGSSDADETDPPANAPVTATLTIQSDWGSGYCANVDVRNTGSSAVTWQVSLTVQGTINNLWNAIYTQTGNTLNARGVDWNRIVNPQGSVQFGFCAVR